jgi:hypothetical protein
MAVIGVGNSAIIWVTVFFFLSTVAVLIAAFEDIKTTFGLFAICAGSETLKS